MYTVRPQGVNKQPICGPPQRAEISQVVCLALSYNSVLQTQWFIWQCKKSTVRTPHPGQALHGLWNRLRYLTEIKHQPVYGECPFLWSKSHIWYFLVCISNPALRLGSQPLYLKFLFIIKKTRITICTLEVTRCHSGLQRFRIKI